MGVLMAGLSPHPPIIIPEIGGEKRYEAQNTITALEELAEEIKGCKPDLLITISPHGPVFTDAISILDQPELEGDFSDFGRPQVCIKSKTRPDFIKRLRESALVKDIEVITLSSAHLEKYNFQGQLDHGVMVPLYYIQKIGLNIPIIPVTMGLLDYNRLYDFGQVIQKTIEEFNLNTVIIASGDLSHRLKPGAPAGFNPRGREFDETIINYLKNTEFENLLELDPVMIEKAGECGLRPLIIMLGSLRGMKIKSDVKSYEGPYGVGYAVVGLYPEEVINNE